MLALFDLKMVCDFCFSAGALSANQETSALERFSAKVSGGADSRLHCRVRGDCRPAWFAGLISRPAFLGGGFDVQCL